MTRSYSIATRCYSIEMRARKYGKRYGFLSYGRNLLGEKTDLIEKTIISYRIKETIVWCCYINRTKCFKNYVQNIAHKASEETGEFIGSKIADKIVNQNLYLMWIQEMLKK